MRRVTDLPDTSIMTKAVLRAGLVTTEQLEEMKRWAPPSLDPDAMVEEPKSLEEAAALIGDAIQSEGYVLMRETDLEAVRQYIEGTQRSLLHIELDDGTQEDIEVTFGLTPIGEYIIPWRSESIRDTMTNGLTYLVHGQAHVYFKDVRELFFGATKAFMVCISSTAEHADH